MTPKIPKISFSVRSAFCLCSFIIWTVLSDIWYVRPQLRYPKEIIIDVTVAAHLERDIFCVSLICSLSPAHVQDASSDAAVIGLLKFQFQIGEEDWLEGAFGFSRDLYPCFGLSRQRFLMYWTTEILIIEWRSWKGPQESFSPTPRGPEEWNSYPSQTTV